MSRKVKLICDTWATFTSWYLLPTIVCGRTWIYVLWLKGRIGFYVVMKP